jgi:hypothetical protein
MIVQFNVELLIDSVSVRDNCLKMDMDECAGGDLSLYGDRFHGEPLLNASSGEKDWCWVVWLAMHDFCDFLVMAMLKAFWLVAQE